MSTRLWDATHLQGVKSLPGAPGYSTQAFLVHFSTCITSVPDDHREPLFCLCKKEKKGSIHLCAFLSFPQGFFKVVSEKKKKSCLHCLLFPLCGIKLHFEGVGWWLGGGGWGVLSCITHREEQGKQTGPDSSNRGSCSAGWGTLGVNQSWTAKLILIRREREKDRRGWIVQTACYVSQEEKGKKSQSGGQNNAWWHNVT